MARSREKTKGRKDDHSFLRLIHPLLDHPNFHALSPRATKLLICIAAQYRGSNNGDLCATYKIMKKRGWNSNDQIQKGLKELLERGWLVKTRQGRRPNVPTLYALTWEAINECGGKLEVKAAKAALNTWRQEPPERPTRTFSDGRHTVQSTPPHGAMEGQNIVSLNRHAAHGSQK